MFQRPYHAKLFLLAAFRYTLIGLFFITGTLRAENGDHLTLRSALQLAKDNNLTLQQQLLLLEQAETEIGIQQTGYYPSLSASSLSSWVFFNKPPINIPGDNDRVSINIFSVGVEQPIFLGFRTVNRVNMAEERLNTQKSSSRSIRDRLLLQTGLLYYDLQLNLLNQDVLQQSLSRARNQLEKTRNLLAAEQVTWFDTLEVSNRMLELTTTLNELEGNFAILQDRIAHLMNVSESPRITLQAVEPPPADNENLDELKQIAMMNRPELGTIHAKRNLQQYQIKLNQAAFYPVISASGGFNYGHLDGFFFTGEWVDFYNVMINFEWELWDWNRDRDKVQQSELELQRLDLEEKQLLLDITNEIKEVYEQRGIISRQIELQKRLYKQEKDRYDITRERYQQGLTTALDLSSAEHALTSAHLQLQRTYIDWYKNNLRLAYVTGQIGNLTEETNK